MFPHWAGAGGIDMKLLHPRSTEKGTSSSYYINFSVGMPHVTNNTTVLHSVKMFSGHYIFVAYKTRENKGRTIMIFASHCIPTLPEFLLISKSFYTAIYNKYHSSNVQIMQKGREALNEIHKAHPWFSPSLAISWLLCSLINTATEGPSRKIRRPAPRPLWPPRNSSMTLQLTLKNYHESNPKRKIKHISRNSIRQEDNNSRIIFQKSAETKVLHAFKQLRGQVLQKQVSPLSEWPQRNIAPSGGYPNSQKGPQKTLSARKAHMRENIPRNKQELSRGVKLVSYRKPKSIHSACWWSAVIKQELTS